MYFQGPIWRSVSQQIIKILNTFPEIHQSRIVVALSGGLDSVFLLAALDQLKRKYDFALLPMHIDHGIQREAKLFSRIARSIARDLGYECQILSIRQKPRGRNLEDWMRSERYRLLRKYCRGQGADYIAVAHHALDQAETVLAHLIRGAGPRGLSGMRPLRGKIIRPLLNCRKDDLEKLMHETHLPYYSDKQNYSFRYQRSKIRHQLIPYLEKELNPQIVSRLSRLAENIQRENKD